MKNMNKHHNLAAAENVAQLPEKHPGEAFPEEYLAPEVNICAFAPESGFAGSILNYNTASAITDLLEVKSEWNTNGEGESFF